MLETGDFVVIHYQDKPRFEKPVGIHWLQAASVSLLSSPEAREVWAYRVPSLLGAMLAAAACVWGAAAFFGPRGRLAGRGHAGGELPAFHRSADRQDRRRPLRGPPPWPWPPSPGSTPPPETDRLPGG